MFAPSSRYGALGADRNAVRTGAAFAIVAKNWNKRLGSLPAQYGLTYGIKGLRVCGCYE